MPSAWLLVPGLLTNLAGAHVQIFHSEFETCLFLLYLLIITSKATVCQHLAACGCRTCESLYAKRGLGLVHSSGTPPAIASLLHCVNHIGRMPS